MPTSKRMEAQRERWFEALNEAMQKRIVTEIQREAFCVVPDIPLGQLPSPSAHRRSVMGVIKIPIMLSPT